MSITFDLEVTEALAATREAMAATTPPPVGDIARRRTTWEPILAAASTALPIPADVVTRDIEILMDDGATIMARWYKTGDAPAGPVSRHVGARDVPMLSVEYRRGPQHPYPTPLEDAYAALQWLHEHADDLGADPERIGVMGDSAGGPKFARQILVLPMLDGGTIRPLPLIESFLTWPDNDSHTAWPALPGDTAGGEDVPATAAPASVDNTSGLPPAYIDVGQLDTFPIPHGLDSIAPNSDAAPLSFADRVRAVKLI